MIDIAAANASFQTQLRVEYEDGRNWIVIEEFVYTSPRITVRVPVGFETDFASIPRLVWRWMSPTDGRIGKPSIVHDFLYRTPAVRFTRKEADNELREAMKCVAPKPKVRPRWPDWINYYVAVLTPAKNAIERNVVYCAVRCFGGPAWKEHRRV